MKKVLITGATGYLGSNLIRCLINDDFEIYCFVRNKNKLRYLTGLKSYVTLIDCYKKIPSDVKLVIHAATNYGRNKESNTEIYYSNVIFPNELIENIKNKNECIFINIDTILPRYTNMYSLTKKHFFELLTINKHIFKAIINIKFDFMYGPNEPEDKFTQRLIKQLKKTNRIPLTSGLQVRNYIYIDDLVEALIIIIRNASSFNIELNKVNEFEISTEEYLTIQSFVKLLYDLMNSKAILGFGDIPYREDELMVTKLKNESIVALGWKSKTDIKKGLIKCLNGVEDDV